MSRLCKDDPVPDTSEDVVIRGSRLVLRPLRSEESDAEWQALVAADPMTIAVLPDESSFKARLRRSGALNDGWLDLAIDVDGESIGRIQTFVPPGRPLPPAVFDVGIRLRVDARGKGYGREALTLLTDWLLSMRKLRLSRHRPIGPRWRCERSSSGSAGS